MCCSLKAQMACTNPSNSIKNYDQQYTFGNKINKLLLFFFNYEHIFIIPTLLNDQISPFL